MSTELFTQDHNLHIEGDLRQFTTSVDIGKYVWRISFKTNSKDESLVDAQCSMQQRPNMDVDVKAETRLFGMFISCRHDTAQSMLIKKRLTEWGYPSGTGYQTAKEVCHCDKRQHHLYVSLYMLKVCSCDDEATTMRWCEQHGHVVGRRGGLCYCSHLFQKR